MASPLKFVYKNFHLIILVGIIAIAIALRLTSADFTRISDYDPWWFFRHTEEILNNNLVPPKWDSLSYYPPGRPVDYYEGWSWTNAVAYLAAKVFLPNISLTRFAGLFIAVFAGLCAIPAYFVGKYVTNKWGGLVTALFGAVTVIFITRSLAGYIAADAADVMYTFIVVLGTLYAMDTWKDFSFSSLRTKKGTKYLFSLLITVFAYWLFALNFNNSWYVYYIFVAFIPLFVIFKILEAVISKKPIQIGSILKEHKGMFLAIILIGVVGEIVTLATSGWPFNTVDPIRGILTGFNFISGQALLVNISIAELQPLNVFTSAGFLQLIQSTGLVPILLGLFGLPLMTVYKLLAKKEIHVAEYFTIVWLILAFWLITRGIRLALLFSLATAAASGFVVGNLVTMIRNRKNILLFSTIIGLLLFGLIWHISDNIQASISAAQGYDIGQNWVDALNWIKNNTDPKSLVVTWWDPGHIITGLTGHPVMADGAHCTPESCIPYNHNIRIQDMGFAFSTSNENDSLQVLQKYEQLTPQQCQLARQTFGNTMPSDACDKVPEMYLIASSDLIGKYYWLSYFGSCLNKYGLKTGQSCYTMSPLDFKSLVDGMAAQNPQDYNFIQLSLSNYGVDQQGNIGAYYYGGGAITIAIRNNSLVPVLNNKYIAREIIYFQSDGTQVRNTFNTTETVDGTVWVDSTRQIAIFMSPNIRNSVFTDLYFFDGQGLKNFQLVFSNGEVKIFKVKL